MKIPRRVVLDENFVVPIRQVAPTVLSGIIGQGKVGAWDNDNKTIWIDKTISQKRKWKVFRHELHHALIDAHNEVEGGI